MKSKELKSWIDGLARANAVPTATYISMLRQCCVRIKDLEDENEKLKDCRKGLLELANLSKVDLKLLELYIDEASYIEIFRQCCIGIKNLEDENKELKSQLKLKDKK